MKFAILRRLKLVVGCFVVLLLTGLIGFISALFFYCQALASGLGRKRWAFAGLLFGPFIWPMFCMKKRMKTNRKFGFGGLIFRA
ncbi:hypothetical protein [Thalassomonas haliotis]|uniref:hypothetical protein n=1 Tax=Thalassomonas haliotis TaxID=485448 RepID=UPI002362528B|nr:hypothetical protein [Thalassomonas haliotis]